MGIYEERPQPSMAESRRQCPLCGGSLEHDEDCELRSLPIEYAARLGLDKARAKVEALRFRLGDDGVDDDI
jgi:hypothetical protein